MGHAKSIVPAFETITYFINHIPIKVLRKNTNKIKSTIISYLTYLLILWEFNVPQFHSHPNSPISSPHLCSAPYKIKQCKQEYKNKSKTMKTHTNKTTTIKNLLASPYFLFLQHLFFCPGSNGALVCHIVYYFVL